MGLKIKALVGEKLPPDLTILIIDFHFGKGVTKRDELLQQERERQLNHRFQFLPLLVHQSVSQSAPLLARQTASRALRKPLGIPGMSGANHKQKCLLLDCCQVTKKHPLIYCFYNSS